MNEPIIAPKAETKEELKKEELGIILQVLAQTAWTGQQWEEIIKPLIAKINIILGYNNY